MASTYSNLKIQLMTTGENLSTWGTVTNTNLGTAIEQALVQTADVDLSSGDVTLSLSNTNAAQDARAYRLNCTGATAARNVIVPAIEKPYVVNNDTSYAVTVKVSGQTGVTVPAGKSMILYNDGTDVVNALTHTPVSSGGTGTNALTANNVILGNGASAVQFVAPGTSGNVLASNGTTWASAALGSMSTQNASAVAITGGTINGAIIGGSSPAAITGTTITASSGFSGNLTGNVTGNLTGTASSATTATTANTVTNGVYTTDFTGSNQSKSSSGYQKFPGGTIIQWGVISGNSCTFPIAFPTACTAVASCSTSTGTGGANNRCNNLSTTGATLGSFSDAGCYFIAIGY